MNNWSDDLRRDPPIWVQIPVLPYKLTRVKIMKMIKLNVKNFNIYTILSTLFLLAGLMHYIYWGTRYNVWDDIGIYSLTIVMVIPGLIGIIISLMDTTEEEN